jgi:hypothetical protein
MFEKDMSEGRRVKAREVRELPVASFQLAGDELRVASRE